MKKWLMGALSVGLVCGLGGSFTVQAQISPAKGGYIFRRKLQKGLTFKYAMSTVIQAKGMPKTPQGPDLSNMKMTTDMKMTILDVVDKKAKVEIVTSELKSNGQKMQDGRKAEVEMSERGQVIQGITGGQMQPGEEVEYPEKPLKVGDVVPIKLGQFGASSIRFIGFKPYKGKDAALWQMPFNLSGKGTAKGAKSAPPKQTMSGMINILISKEDGWPLSTTVTIDISAQNGGQNITAKSTATIVRQ